jgi:S1-C subfamily serine protease
MEGLTKQQLILLALLVSFVTSMATGIVTVSLMDQAPQSVTRTIDRVVERTVEKIVPAENSASVVSTKETIVVKADDQVVSGVEKVSKSLVRIIRIKEQYGVRKERVGGIGVFVGKKGLLVSDIGILSKELDEFGGVIPETYEVSLSGKRYQIVPVGTDDGSNLVFFEVKDSEGKTLAIELPNAVKIGDSDTLKLGQSVVILGGKESDTVATGIISSLVSNDSSLKYPGKWKLLKVDVKFNDAIYGSPVINLSGEMIGIFAGQYSLKDAYLPVKFISESLPKVETTKSNFTF